MKLRAVLAAAVVAAVSVASGACGGGDEASTTAASDAADTAAPTTSQLEARDFDFAPANLSAPAGGRITITVTNTGKAPHTFTAKAVGVDEQIGVGESKDVSFTMPASGPLDYVCTLHEAQGMKGTVEAA